MDRRRQCNVFSVFSALVWMQISCFYPSRAAIPNTVSTAEHRPHLLLTRRTNPDAISVDLVNPNATPLRLMLDQYTAPTLRLATIEGQPVPVDRLSLPVALAVPRETELVVAAQGKHRFDDYALLFDAGEGCYLLEAGKHPAFDVWYRGIQPGRYTVTATLTLDSSVVFEDRAPLDLGLSL